MHGERIDKSVAEAESAADREILDLIVYDDQAVWSVDEIAREFGAPVDDELGRLYGAGLVHRIEGGFVVATRAATKAYELTS